MLDRAERVAESTGDLDALADVPVGRLLTYSAVSTLSHRTLSWVERLNSLRHNCGGTGSALSTTSH